MPTIIVNIIYKYYTKTKNCIKLFVDIKVTV